jgi:cytosine/adenosine deaminase-related metal-dependent hydrolase
MSTAGGAHASGQHIGALEVGAHADFVALDMADLSLLPAHNLLSNAVYA